MSKIRYILSQNLKRLIDRKNWNQRDLGTKARIGVGNIEAYCQENRWPGSAYIDAIAKALDVSPSELFKDPEEISETIEMLAKKIESLERENTKLKSHPILEAYEKAELRQQKAVRTTLNIEDKSDPLNALAEPDAAKSRRKNHKSQ